MINLLPNDIKKDTGYARSNSILRRWIGVFLLTIVGIGVITVFGLFYINQSINSYSSEISKTTQELKDQKLEETEKKVQDISTSLQLVVKVLSRQIMFSSLIKQVAVSIPQNAVLASLEIPKTEGGIDISASAKDYNTATQVQVNLQDPKNKIFDKADIINISCSTSSGADKNYPCTVKIRAQFSKDNPFLFINEKAKP